MKLYFKKFRNLLSKKSDNYFDTCEKMPLYNFKMFIETNDLKWFSKDLKYHTELQTVADKFFTNYIELTNNQKVQNRYVTMFEIMRLENKYRCVTILLKALYNYDKRSDMYLFNQMIELLEQWNYKIDKSKDIFKQFENINNRLQGIKTKIELLKAKIDDGNKEVEKPNFEKELLNISRVLELNYKLSIKDLNVAEFIAYQMEANEVVKLKNKANG